MKRFKISFLATVVLVAVASLFTVCKASGANNTVYPDDTGGEVAAAGPPDTQYAAAAAGDGLSMFNAVAKDANGNTYAAGSQHGSEIFTYGPGVSAQGNTSQNAVLVKYDSTGAAQWAKVVVVQDAGDPDYDESSFDGVAVDGSGNIYVAGSHGLSGPGTIVYGPGVSVQGNNSQNAVLVKYDSAGDAQWVKTTASPNTLSFSAVAVDGSGNVYAAGHQYGDDSLDYGDGNTVQGSSSDNNAVIAKYDCADGRTLWAQSVSGGNYSSKFHGVAADGSGVYAVGLQNEAGTLNYGGINVTGANDRNAVIVKYNSAGTALWAQSVNGGSDAEFYGVAADGSGNIYAAGIQATGNFTYGTNAYSATGGVDINAVIVKYTGAGAALWATAAQGGARSGFAGVAAGGPGSVYAAGAQFGALPCDFGGVSSTISYAGAQAVLVKSGASEIISNAVIVQYNSDTGAALWAQAASPAASISIFNGVAADRTGAGNISAAGYQYGTGVFNYGNNITAQGSYNHENAVIIGYK